MQKAFERVREIAGENTIFEGVSSLPEQLAARLSAKDWRLAVSESFTAGLLNWRLQSAAVPLVSGELLPNDNNATLSSTLLRAKQLAERSGAGLALAVSALSEGRISLALYTPTGSNGLTIRYTATRHGLTLRQETMAMVAMDMLRRYLNGWPVVADYPWLDSVEKV